MLIQIRPQDSKGPLGLIQQIRGPPGDNVSICLQIAAIINKNNIFSCVAGEKAGYIVEF